MSDHVDMTRTHTTQPTVVTVTVSVPPSARYDPMSAAVIRQWAANERHTRSTKVDDPIDNQHEEHNPSELSRPIVPVTSTEPDWAATLAGLEECLAEFADLFEVVEIDEGGGEIRRWR